MLYNKSLALSENCCDNLTNVPFVCSSKRDKVEIKDFEMSLCSICSKVKDRQRNQTETGFCDVRYVSACRLDPYANLIHT